MQNAKKYTKVLEKSLLPFIQLHNQDKVLFQQDTAAIHTAKYTKTWIKLKILIFSISNIPTKSPDLNPIKNLRGILSR